MSFNLGNMWKKVKKKNDGFVKKPNNYLKGMVKINNIKSSRLSTGSKMGTKGFWGNPTWILFHALAEKADSE